MTLHAERWIRWLANPVARDPATGLWLSWCDPKHPGYAYEEATAWVILVAAGLRQRPNARPLLVAAEQALGPLSECVRARGGLGRDGRVYAFDTAVGLAACLAWGGAHEIASTLLGTLLSMCDRRRAVEDGPTLGQERVDTRWSEAWGGHLLWLAGPLRAAGEAQQAATLVRDLLPRLRREDGLLRIHGANDTVYAHGALYGAEGLMAAGHVADARAVVTALLRGPGDGALVPAWPLRSQASGRADATAQALFLATATQAPVSDSRLEGARRALQRLTAEEGGLRYESGSADLNTCATAFALRPGVMAR
jgi:hypothetical protein